MRSWTTTKRLLSPWLRRLADLVRRGTARQSPSVEAFEMIPRGRREPFVTGEYDVLPRGAFDFVRHDYYSPIPDLSALPEGIWERRTELGGVELGVERAVAYLEEELAPFIAELEFPERDPGEPGVFFLRNLNYESVDAEVLYAMVRANRPGHVLELGSGYTTLLIGEACRRNAADGHSTRHSAFDPYPRPHILGDGPPPPTRFFPMSATDVPLDAFARLDSGDILFVDTTHTVKLGGDVNFLVLDVLPRLAPGVIVHFHDVFLPFEYPRTWFEEMHYIWAEQYLVQAFLAYNDAFEVIFPGQAVARDHPDRVAAVVPTFGPGVSPANFWLRRRRTGVRAAAGSRPG
jgi:hypothetical protein